MNILYALAGSFLALIIIRVFFVKKKKGEEGYQFGLGEGPVTTMELKNNTALRETYSSFRETMMQTLAQKFDNLQVIAAGGMGIIVSGYDKVTGQKMAIKTISPKLYQNPKAIKYFFQECQAIQRMNHPNIIRILDLGEEDFLYYTMEFLNGETLEAVMTREGVLPLDLIIRIGTQVARALEHCHSNGIVHRDIKPSNVFITEKNHTCKIIDFGVVQAMDGQRLDTAGGIGSPYYASPEQIHGRRVTGKSDVFGLGVCLYKMISTVFPYEKSFTDDLNQVPKELKSLNPDIPDELNDTVMGSIKIDMQERLSANDVWAQLRKLQV